jgi:hypothetical protein
MFTCGKVGRIAGQLPAEIPMHVPSYAMAKLKGITYSEIIRSAVAAKWNKFAGMCEEFDTESTRLCTFAA